MKEPAIRSACVRRSHASTACLLATVSTCTAVNRCAGSGEERADQSAMFSHTNSWFNVVARELRTVSHVDDKSDEKVSVMSASDAPLTRPFVCSTNERNASVQSLGISKLIRSFACRTENFWLALTICVNVCRN